MTGCFLTLCETGIFKTRGIFRTLSNIYDGKFYSQSCVALVYLEPWHIQNPRHIRNTAKHLSSNILFETLCNTDRFRILSIFRTLVYSEIKAYSEPSRISKMEHFLLRALCNYSRFRGPIYSKLSHIQNRYVSATP